MKRIVFLLFLFISSLACISQNVNRYGEMLCDGIHWGFTGKYTTESYDINGFKTMNGKTYGLLQIERRLFDGSRASDNNLDDYYKWLTATIGIRDEGGRIYVDKEEYLSLMTEEHYWELVGQSENLPYETTTDGELVLYDFNKNAGDVYCQMTDGSALMVTKVDVLKTEDGVSRRRLTLSNGFDLIEGIGCTNAEGFLLFWLNTKSDFAEFMKDMGLLTYYGSDKPLLIRDYDATINEHQGRPNKMMTQGRRWVYDYDNGQMKGTLTYTIDGDTLLHAFRRAKINMTLTDHQTNKVVRSSYAGAFTEQDGHLCFLAPETNEDTRLYLFGWGIRYYREIDGISRYMVNDDNIIVGDESFHRYQLVNRKQGQELPMDKDSLYYWVEGIGSSKGLLEYRAGTLMDSIQFVACYDGEKCIFTNDDFWKESGQPSKFAEDIWEGLLKYNIQLGTKTARMLHSDNYQSLSNVIIPPSVDLWGVDCVVNKIDKEAFKDITALTNIEIPGSVTTIEEKTFYGCIGLLSVDIPEGVIEISDNAFCGCTGVTSLSLPSTLVTIKDHAFQKLDKLTSLVLPENIKTVGSYAFAQCAGLAEIDIPASIEVIKNLAFGHNPQLTDVYCRATTLPQAHAASFHKSNLEGTLHVPAASINLYKSTEPWSNFRNIVPLEETNAIVIQNEDLHNKSFVDLQGRPVKSTLKHGIYVKDGKKVVR